MKKFLILALILFISFSAFAARQSSISINGGYTYTHQNIYIASDSENGAKLLEGKQSSELAYSYHVSVKADTFFESGLGFEASAAMDKYFRYNYMTCSTKWLMTNAPAMAAAADTHTELWGSELDEFGWITTIAAGPAYRFDVSENFKGQMALMGFWTHSTLDSGDEASKALNFPAKRTDDYIGVMYELSGKYFVSEKMFINFGVSASAAFLWNINMKLDVSTIAPLIGSSSTEIDEDLKAKDYDAHRFAASPFIGIGMSF